MPGNFAQVEDMEQIARKKELGIWSKELRLVSENNSQDSHQFKYKFLEQITVEMTHAVDGKIFHLRVLDKNANYDKIDKLLANFDTSKSEEL